MNKLMKEDGTFTDFGKAEAAHLRDAIDMVLYHKDSCEMTINELRTLGSLITKMVGDAVSERLQRKTFLVSKLQSMSDDEFLSYLKERYGDDYLFKSLTPEEFERCPGLSQTALEKAMKEGVEARKALEHQSSFMPPRGYFKKE